MLQANILHKIKISSINELSQAKDACWWVYRKHVC